MNAAEKENWDLSILKSCTLARFAISTVSKILTAAPRLCRSRNKCCTRIYSNENSCLRYSAMEGGRPN